MTVRANSAVRVLPRGQRGARGRHRASPCRRRRVREQRKHRRPPTSRRPALCGPSVAAIRGGLPRPASRAPSHRGRAFSSCPRVRATDGSWRRGLQSDHPIARRPTADHAGIKTRAVCERLREACGGQCAEAGVPCALLSNVRNWMGAGNETQRFQAEPEGAPPPRFVFGLFFGLHRAQSATRHCQSKPSTVRRSPYVRAGANSWPCDLT